MTAPAPGVLNTSGWTLSVETEGAIGGGYLPVVIRLTPSPPAPTTRPRTVRVDLHVTRYNSRDTFSREITVPAGSTGTQELIYLTLGRAAWWNDLLVLCYEDGQELTPLRGRLAPRNGPQSGQTEEQASLLFLDNDAPPRRERRAVIERLIGSTQPARLPDFRDLSLRLSGPKPNVTYGSWNNEVPRNASTDAVVLMDLERIEDADLIPTSELPENWLSLSNYDMTFVSWPDLEQLIQARDGRWPALRSWISAGHTLCVYGLGKDFADLPKLESRVGLSHLKGPGTDGRPAGWSTPQESQHGRPFPGIELNNVRAAQQVLPNGTVTYNMVPGMAAPTPPPPTAAAVPASPRDAMRFLSRELGFGLVVVIESSDPFPGKMSDWDWLLNSVGENRIRPLARLGVSRMGDNPDFGNFLVQGVGKAPVWAFLILLTLFMVAIGPVNYFLLRHIRRLHLLYVTVPASAALVTLTLLTYAVISDGLHVRSRIRSATYIDQLAGTSASWSRQVYFAGLAPRDGLVYPPHVLVQPIERWGWQLDSRNRGMDWSNGQRYSYGYLPSRTMAQMLVIDPHPTSASLRIRLAEDGSGACRIRNELGVALEALLVRDEQGRYYFTERVEEGGELSLAAVDRQVAYDVFRQARSNSVLGAPLWDDTQSYRRRRWVWWGATKSGSQQTGLLEAMLSRCDVSLYELPLRSYIALAERPLETAVGADADERQRDVHLVLGAW
ncbi:MAG: hypothetical protein U0935_21585 [Pirellulales bacterium]